MSFIKSTECDRDYHLCRRKTYEAGNRHRERKSEKDEKHENDSSWRGWNGKKAEIETVNNNFRQHCRLRV